MSLTKKPRQKTQSERFRHVLYQLWLQDKDGFEEFDTFYEDRMEKLIEYYKKRLNSLVD